MIRTHDEYVVIVSDQHERYAMGRIMTVMDWWMNEMYV